MGETTEHDGCDCTELCSMGPTCPGGMLARLPGSGCGRTGETDPVRSALAAFVESDAVQYALTVVEAGHRTEAIVRLRDAATQQAAIYADPGPAVAAETLTEHRICNARYGQVACYCSAIDWMTLDEYGEHIEAIAAAAQRADLTARLTDPDVIEAVLREHTLHDNGKRWTCVMSSDVHPQRVLLCRWSHAYKRLNPDAAHRAHVAAAVRDALTGGAS